MKSEDNSNLDFGQKKRIAYLVAGFLEDKLSPGEKSELDSWINASDSNQRIFENLIDPKKLKQSFEQLDSLELEAAWQRINQRKKDVKPPIRNHIFKYAAAAAMILAVGLGYLYFSNKTPDKPVVTAPQDILPGSNKATLTLANGSTLSLNDLPTGTIAQNIKKNKDGELIYDSINSSDLQYNVLTTPNGGQYTVTLSDGSRVTLNAASSLKYPLTFSGRERNVELTGEAYFEVAKDAGKPFIVSSAGQKVQVLGTKFNINAYADEKLTATTLVEGKVKVIASGNELILSPGGQAIVDSMSNLKAQAANLEESLAWKEGNFEFVKTPLTTIMRQVARWYDAEIIYEGPISLHYHASVSRNTPVSKLLHYLEETGTVHFTITGNKIIVKP